MNPTPFLSRTSRGAANEAPDRTERVHRWTAALLTALLHALLVLLVMPPAPPIGTSAPQGGASGGRIDVTLHDESVSAPPPEPQPEPIVRKRIPRKKPKAPPAVARAPAVPVEKANPPMPPEKADTNDDASEPPASAPATPRETPENPTHAWGQPPGMRRDDNALANAELAAKLGSGRGHSDTPAPSGPNMDVDGFNVYYDLVDEIRVREWRRQGMTELFLPLPGTRRLMVCPLEVVRWRGSGPCRMVEFDSPELKSIGDAREVIKVQQIYQRGERVWSGPGPYR